MSNFETEFGNRRIGFLIRKFEERDDRNTLIKTVRDSFRERGLKIVDASEKNLHSETWGNIKQFMDHCSYGVVVIDNFSPTNSGFNPNVFLEIGYLLALKKDILILIQNSLADKLPTDIKPFLYTSFDSQEIQSPQLRQKIIKWIDNTVNYNPGYLSVYLKGEIVSVDLISEFKEVVYAISDCNITESSKLIAPDQKELDDECIDCPDGARKITFRTQTKNMADKLVADYENNFYTNVPFLHNSLLKIKANSSAISESYADGGIHYLFNDEKEALIYCQNQGIEGCKDEEHFASSNFKLKKTSNHDEIEIFILPKFDNENTFLYISNYLQSENRFCIKMCHYPKDNSRIVVPFHAVDILYLIIFGELPDPKRLKINSDYRKRYLEIVDLHLDKVIYNVENRIAIEPGIAKNVKYFDHK
ncbi:hypothetical protein AWN68_02675 [Roseivirga echinicomitans]|uniref:CD-NTase-associated protein 12/Pycsar effector protein TIR domain-containing protein n=2 Tax=Roseivirga echinicomitans TaxID=296218 RepID=A0A150XYD2_9BACT|nr:hypothetical protein AWN68_02675 [Roseivirga echinicomitans]